MTSQPVEFKKPSEKINKRSLVKIFGLRNIFSFETRKNVKFKYIARTKKTRFSVHSVKMSSSSEQKTNFTIIMVTVHNSIVDPFEFEQD